MSDGKHVRQILFTDESNEYINPAVAGRSESAVLQELAQYHIAHSETQGREIDATELLQQVIVSAAAADGPERSSGIEQLEDYSGIVGESPDDGEVNLDKIAEPHLGERLVDLPQRFAGFDRLGRLFQLMVELLPAANPGDSDKIICGGWLKHFSLIHPKRLNLFGSEPLVLVDEIESLSETVRSELPMPQDRGKHPPVGQTHPYITRPQPERTHAVDGQGDDFRIGQWPRLSNQVAVQLEVLSKPPPLLPLITEQLGNGEPADRLSQFTRAGGHHPRQGRSHLRPQGNRAVALVGKAVQLPYDLLATLGGVEIQRLQRRTVVLLKPVAGGHRSPGIEDVGPQREIGGVKITKARQGLGFHAGSIKR